MLSVSGCEKLSGAAVALACAACPALTQLVAAKCALNDNGMAAVVRRVGGTEEQKQQQCPRASQSLAVRGA